MLDIKLLSSSYHIFFDGKLLFIEPLISVGDLNISMTSSCYTYLVCVEPKLFNLGLINRSSVDLSEII